MMLVCALCGSDEQVEETTLRDASLQEITIPCCERCFESGRVFEWVDKQEGSDMGKAVILISPEVLSEALLFPDSVKITSVHPSSKGWLHDGLALIVESEQFDKNIEGTEYPIISPTYTKDASGLVALLDIGFLKKV